MRKCQLILSGIGKFTWWNQQNNIFRSISFSGLALAARGFSLLIPLLGYMELDHPQKLKLQNCIQTIYELPTTVLNKGICQIVLFR